MMALSPVCADAVSAVEDSLLRGEWMQALSDSRGILAARIEQILPTSYDQLRHEANDTAIMMTEEERVLSVYLQAVFELDIDDEVETAVTIVQCFALPCGTTIQWSNFLIAMNRRLMAKKVLEDLLESFAVHGEEEGFCIEQYTKATEMMALQVLLPDEGIEAAQKFVTDDNVLDDEVKLQLLRQIQATYLACQKASEDSLQTSASSQTTRDASSESQATDVVYQSAFAGKQQPAAKQDDESSCYVIIGGTAITLAIAAAGALRYREKIHECLSNVIPAISKGVADAKYALFEA